LPNVVIDARARISGLWIVLLRMPTVGVLLLLLRFRFVFGWFLRLWAIRSLGIRAFGVRTFGGTLALLGVLSGGALLLHIPLLLPLL
jgi:hypothetical protein